MSSSINCSLGTELLLPSAVTPTIKTVWRIETRLAFTTTALGTQVGLLYAKSDRFKVSISIGTKTDFNGREFISVNAAGSSVPGYNPQGTYAINDGEFHDFVALSDGVNRKYYIDGAELVKEEAFTTTSDEYPFSAGGDLYPFNQITRQAELIKLEYIKFYDSADTSVLMHSWEASASETGATGLQPVLVDSVAGNNATGAGFPTDGSAFIVDTVPPSLTATQATLTPGSTISGTYADYATIPTTLTVSDGTNSITIPTPTIFDNGTGGGTYSGTTPALPTTGSASGVLFGDVTVELT